MDICKEEKMALHYSKAQYEKKITQLESYAVQINAHLDQLENYKSQIKQVWDDENAVEYMRSISKSIRACRNAVERINNLRDIYRNAMGDMTAVDEGIKEIIEDVNIATGSISGE